MPTRYQLELDRVRAESEIDEKSVEALRVERKRNEAALHTLKQARNLSTLEKDIQLAKVELERLRKEHLSIREISLKDVDKMMSEAKASAAQVILEASNRARLIEDKAHQRDKELDEAVKDFQADKAAFALRESAFVERRVQLENEHKKLQDDLSWKSSLLDRKDSERKEAWEKERAVQAQEKESIREAWEEIKRAREEVAPVLELRKEVENGMAQVRQAERENTVRRQAAERTQTQAESRFREADSKYMAALTLKEQFEEERRKLRQGQEALAKAQKEVRVREDNLKLKEAQLQAKYGV